MTKHEIDRAKTALATYCDRTDVAVLDSGGYALTAYWITGGQKIFYALERVLDHVADIKARS